MFIFGSIRSWRLSAAWGLLLLALIPFEDTNPSAAHVAYDHAWILFQHGRLADSEREAEQGNRQFQISRPEWASKFQLLEAQIMVSRGKYSDALHVLASCHPASDEKEEYIRKLAIEADAMIRQLKFLDANQKLTEAQDFCKGADYIFCGYVLRTRGILAARQGQLADAQKWFMESLLSARVHKDRWSEAGALNNLGFAAMQTGHFDESLDWSRSAYRVALEFGAEDKAMIASGNLGWAFYELGDDEKALDQFLEAEKSATRLGNLRDELKWISDAGYVYRDSGDLTRAAQSYRQALDLARQIDSKEDIVNADRKSVV